MVGRLGYLTHKNPGVVRQRPERHIQRLVHLLAVALEEPAAACRQSENIAQGSVTKNGLASVKQSIPRKHNLVVAVLHEEADAVLGMARRMQRLDGNVADVEGRAVRGCLGYLLAVLAADDLEGLVEFRKLRLSDKSVGYGVSGRLTSSSFPPAWSQ